MTKWKEALEAFASRPLNVVSNLITVVGFVGAVVLAAGWNAQAIPVIYISGLSLFLILRYVRQERWSRYAEGMGLMNQAVREMKEATESRLYGTLGKDDVVLALRPSLASFAAAFSLVTGTRCRASIKEVYEEEVEIIADSGSRLDTALFVATLTRNDEDAWTASLSEKPDPVSGNTDFEYAMSTLTPFCEGDLPKLWRDRQYENTHWTQDLHKSKDFPYRSAIVWPIACRTLKTSEGKQKVIAFLCVDSKARSAFRKRADTNFGGVYAQALYPLLRYDLDGKEHR